MFTNHAGESTTVVPPRGHWKGGIFGCCNDGICSAYLCCSLWCTNCSMGQVMHRLKLNWLGGQAGHLKTIRTFQVVATLAVLYWISRALFTWVYTLGKQGGTWMSNFTTSDGRITTGGIFLMMFFIGLTVFNLFFVVWSLCALTRTRMHVREKYGIRGSACGDFCCALWCRCCTVAQLHRHTGQYETHASVCCSKTGLHHGVNVV